MNVNQPIFKSVFAKQWEQLPIVLRKHYMHKQNTNEIVVVKGKMDVTVTGIMKYLLPVFKVFKVLAPYTGKNIPVVVYLRSFAHQPVIQFERVFYFPNKFPCYFQSAMRPLKENKVVEYTWFGLGWKINYLLENNKIRLQHAGYVGKLFGFFIPLPLTALLGKIETEQEAMSEDTFNLKMQIRHPLLGSYAYTGRFKI